MNVLIAYATTEGQTEKIANFIGTKLSEAGHEVHYQNVSEFTKGHSVTDFDEVIIAGSVHSSKPLQSCRPTRTSHSRAATISN